MSSMPKQKRNRASKVCDFCKKRKVKCDLGNPCSTCVKFGNRYCTYKTISSNQINNENGVKTYGHNGFINIVPRQLRKKIDYKNSQSLNENIRSLPISDDMINFLADDFYVVGNDYGYRRVFSPLSWFSLSRSDNYLASLVDYIERNKKNFTTINEDIEAYTLDISLFKKNDLSNRTHVNLEDGLSNNTTGLYVQISNEETEESLLIKKINHIIPTRKIVWEYVRIFFDTIYPFVPVLDEAEFRDNLQQIIGKSGYDSKIELLIKRKTDYAIIGILLILMRLSNSSFTNCFSEQKVTNGLNDSTISHEVFKLAKNCLDMFDLFKCTDIKVLQFLLFLRFYYMYVPDENGGFDGRLSRSLNSRITQIASSIGLNRDPDHLPSKYRDKKLDNLSRKIWHLIILLDYDHAMVFGDPLITKVVQYDTKIPFYNLGNENINNLELEKELMYSYCGLYTLFPHFESFIDTLFNFNGYSFIGNIIDKLMILEKSCLGLYNSLNSKLDLKHMFTLGDLMSFRFYLYITNFISSVYYKLLDYYEKKINYNMVRYISVKFLIYSVRDTFPLYSVVLKERFQIFKNYSDFSVVPSIIMSIQKTLFTLMTIMIRVKYLQFKLSSHKDFKENPDIFFQKTEKLASLISSCATYNIELLKKMSNKDYIAWRLFKVYTFSFSASNTDKFYEQNIDNILKSNTLYDERIVDDIIEILILVLEDRRIFNRNDLVENGDDISLFSDELKYPHFDTSEFDEFWSTIMSSRINTFNYDSTLNEFFEIDDNSSNCQLHNIFNI